MVIIYIDQIQKNIRKKCYKNCKTCKELGNKKDNKYESCKIYLIWDSYNINNCVSKWDKY